MAVSARAARNLREIQHVKNAISWAKADRARRADFVKQRKANKDHVVQSLRYTQNFKVLPAREARQKLIEDWNLGPLRPKRAYGDEAEKYGLLDAQVAGGGPDLPEHVYKDTVLAIEEDDRVVVLRGRAKNQIGVVEKINKANNTVTIKDTNMVFIDGASMLAPKGEEPKIRQELALPVPLNDVRLVVTQKRQEPNTDPDAPPIQVEKDVIVEAIELRKHTRGIDPWDAKYKDLIDKEHQVYPETDEPIYSRFIAGTNEAIEWPWEKLEAIDEKEEKERKQKRVEAGDTTAGGEDRMTPLRRAKSAAGRAWARAKGVFPFSRAPAAAEETASSQSQELNQDESLEAIKPPRPRAPESPWRHKADTNAFTVGDPTYEPHLLFAPFPDGVIDEVRDPYSKQPLNPVLKAEKNAQKKKEKEQEGRIQKEERREKESQRSEAEVELTKKERRQMKGERKVEKKAAREAQMMALAEPTIKTPLQLRWELAQRGKKALKATEVPHIDAEVLQAIGQAMIKAGRRHEDIKPQAWTEAKMQRGPMEPQADTSVLMFPAPIERKLKHKLG